MNKKRRYFVDMEGVLKQLKRTSESDDTPNTKLIFCLNTLIELDEDVNVISHYSSEFPDEKRKKIDWLNTYFPRLKNDHIYLFDYSIPKSSFFSLTYNDILIDDYDKNLLDWKSKGGTAIKFENEYSDEDSIWHGPIVSTMLDCYALFGNLYFC